MEEKMSFREKRKYLQITQKRYKEGEKKEKRMESS